MVKAILIIIYALGTIYAYRGLTESYEVNVNSKPSLSKKDRVALYWMMWAFIFLWPISLTICVVRAIEKMKQKKKEERK